MPYRHSKSLPSTGQGQGAVGIIRDGGALETARTQSSGTPQTSTSIRGTSSSASATASTACCARAAACCATTRNLSAWTVFLWFEIRTELLWLSVTTTPTRCFWRHVRSPTRFTCPRPGFSPVFRRVALVKWESVVTSRLWKKREDAPLGRHLEVAGAEGARDGSGILSWFLPFSSLSPLCSDCVQRREFWPFGQYSCQFLAALLQLAVFEDMSVSCSPRRMECLHEPHAADCRARGCSFRGVLPARCVLVGAAAGGGVNRPGLLRGADRRGDVRGMRPCLLSASCWCPDVVTPRAPSALARPGVAVRPAPCWRCPLRAGGRHP